MPPSLTHAVLLPPASTPLMCLPQVYFGLPGPEQRAAILAVRTRKWPRPPAPQLLQQVCHLPCLAPYLLVLLLFLHGCQYLLTPGLGHVQAAVSCHLLPTPAIPSTWSNMPGVFGWLQVAGLAEGYAGADLQALCTAAVMAAARRAAPALIDLAEQQAAAAAGSAPAPPGGVQQQEQQQGGKEQQQQQQDWGGSAGLGAAPAHAPSQQGVAAEGAAGGGLQEQEREAALHSLLEGVHVEPRDWWEALAAAPAPCSRRHGLSALSAGAVRPLAPHLLPLLAPAVASVLRVLHSSTLPLPAAASTAVAAACQLGTRSSNGTEADAAGPSRSKACTATDAFAAILRQLGAVAAPASPDGPPGSQHLCSNPEGSGGAGLSTGALGAAPTGAQYGQEGGAAGSLAGPHGGSGCWVPCRVLLAGEGERGQEAAAGAVLKLLEGEQMREGAAGVAPVILMTGACDLLKHCANSALP